MYSQNYWDKYQTQYSTQTIPGQTIKVDAPENRMDFIENWP